MFQPVPQQSTGFADMWMSNHQARLRGQELEKILRAFEFFQVLFPATLNIILLILVGYTVVYWRY